MKLTWAMAILIGALALGQFPPSRLAAQDRLSPLASITGRVVDDQTGEAIRNARVTITATDETHVVLTDGEDDIAVTWMGEQWKNLKNKGAEVKLNIA